MTTEELRAKFESETGRSAVVINQYTYPTEQYFNWLEQQLVKLFAIPVVVGRSEQLFCGTCGGLLTNQEGRQYCKDCRKYL